MPTEELGAPAYRKFDIETWIPSKKDYGEVTSCSNCTDYQSRRLNIRYKLGTGNNPFVHTINGTACAIPRTILGLLEHFFDPKTEHLILPATLVPYMGGKERIHLPQRKA